MVICKYYQQGNCRFGDRCRFEHPRGGYSNYGNNNNNAYKWYGDGRGGGGGGGRDSSSVTFSTQNRFETSQPDNRSASSKTSHGSQLSQMLATSTNEILGSIAADMTTWGESKMWHFSCYSYWKDGACLPGLEDVSPEEMRLEAYTAQKSGNIQEYILKVNNMVNKFCQLRTELMRPSMQTKQKLIQFLEEERRRIEKGESPHPSSSMSAEGAFTSAGTASFGGNTGFGSTSVFGSTSQQSGNLFGKSSSVAGQSIFGGSSSAFGQPAANPSQPASFANLAAGVQSSSSAGNVFGGIASFGTGEFGSSQSPNSIFGNPSEKSVFGPSAAPTGQATLGSSGATTLGSTSGASGFGNSSGATPFGSTGGATPFGSTGGATPFGSTGGATPFGSTGGALTFGSTGAAPLTGTGAASVNQATGGQAFVALNSSQAVPASSSGPRSSIYTPLEELTAEERQQFEAAQFTPGKLPTRPPPKELCP